MSVRMRAAGWTMSRSCHVSLAVSLWGATNLHDGGAVICDGLPAVGVDEEKVPTIGPERALDGGLDGEAGVDV
jgi:hypothetical protein